MSEQSTSQVIMVRPAAFYSDPATAASNAFQSQPESPTAKMLETAQQEFDQAVATMLANGIAVEVIQDDPQPAKPNAIFPNNWFSTHADGTMVLYPMATASRRSEREIPVVDRLGTMGFEINEIIDMSFYEEENQFLEGTGSLVLDRVNRVAYACLAERTDPELVRTFGYELGFDPFVFHAVDPDGKPIYHTNVMLSVGSGYAIACLESVQDDFEREELQAQLEQWGHAVIPISYRQMQAFAGNALEVKDHDGNARLLISTSGWGSLDAGQQATLKSFVDPIILPVDTIQKAGGGGIRCMVAEVFLPKA